MTAGAYAHPTISRFAIADGMLRIGGLPMSERLRPALPEARILLELGRFLVGEAGGYVTRVVDRKESRSHTFLVVDGGLHHQLAASGNFGQVIRKNYPVTIAIRMGVPGAETVSVVGCLCTPLDLLARDVCLPRAEIGDLVGGLSGPRLRDDGQSHSVPRPSDTDGGVGVDRRPPGLHDR
ncbi:hypothetical protein [Streptomyces sp. NPDC001820]|uniref:hypothetical protein n=1 Tax=Streptomyces sp. NPDC001820 TaxID=3364613 RepID=UPI0036BC8048